MNLEFLRVTSNFQFYLLHFYGPFPPTSCEDGLISPSQHR